MTPRGFSIIELAVALTLSAVVASAGYVVLDRTRRAYATQLARVELNQDVRTAIAILAGELRSLDPGDPDGSDIVAMTPASLSYRATRSLRFLCREPVSATQQITLAADPRFGDEDLSLDPRALLLYARGDSSAHPAGRWLRITASRRAEGAVCPGGRAGTAVWLTDVTPVELSQVEVGAPLRSTELLRIQPYRDADGVYWLGVRTGGLGGVWSDLQPFAGPVAAGGLQFDYYDTEGRVASSPASVARIGLTVIGRAPDPRAQAFRLSTQVAPRNGPRW